MRVESDKIRSMFDRIAPRYDALNRLLSAGIDRSWRERAIQALAAAPPGPMLDSCAGTLDLTALMCRAFPERELVAADFSKTMLDLGAHKARSARTVVADAMALPFDDGAFAAMVCGFGMRNLEDLRRGVAEARRVLRPGGIFVTLEFFRAERPATRAFHAAYANVVLPTVGGIVSGDRSAYAYLAKSMQSFASRTEYEAVLREEGFVRVRGEDLTLGIAALVHAEVPR